MVRAGPGRRLPPRYARVGPLVVIPALLSGFGVSSASVLQTVGLDGDAFSHPDNALPFEVVCRLVAACAAATGREDFGLLIGASASPSDLGLVGFLMKQAPDAGTALDDLVRFLHHQDTGAVPFVRRRDGVAELGYAIIHGAATGCDEVYDGAIAIGWVLMRALCGPRWSPIEVTLSRPRPRNAGRYVRFFGSPVRFDAERSALLFAESWLDTPIAGADAALRSMLWEQIQLLEEQPEGSLADRVRRHMRIILLSRRGRLDEVADDLQLSRRALERRLEEEGCSFRKLSEEMRSEVARQWLEGTRMSITQIALALSFSEVSSFSRAFRQWSGVAPREWRATHGQGRQGR